MRIDFPCPNGFNRPYGLYYATHDCLAAIQINSWFSQGAPSGLGAIRLQAG